MMTFKQLLINELYDEFSNDRYTGKIEYIQVADVKKLMEKSYLLGKIQGIEFGNSWEEMSEKPQIAINELKFAFKFLTDNEIIYE